MRTLLISLAAASAVAVATPAVAQWAPAPRGYAYGNNHHGLVQALHARVNYIQREIQRLAQYRIISSNEYRNLRNDSREIERRLSRNARDGYGLSPREAQSVERRIARLEQKIARDARDGRRWSHRW